jgi:hypothetical protein
MLSHAVTKGLSLAPGLGLGLAPELTFSWTTNGPTRRRMTSRVLGLVGHAVEKWSRMTLQVESEVLSPDVARGGGVSEGGTRRSRALPLVFE